VATRSTFPLLLALACAVPAVGCNVGGGKTASTSTEPPGRATASSGWNPFASREKVDAKLPQLTAKDEEQFADAKEDLKDPIGLYLPLARLQESDGRLEEARRSYAFVLREDPRSKDGLLGLARLDQLAGRTLDAEERFQQVANAHPNDPHVVDALGQFYAAEQRWPEAARTLDRAARLDPEDATIQFHVAVATARTGDVDRARSHFARAVGPAEAHYNLGYVLFDEGRLDEAEREFIAAITKQPGLEQAQVMLGELRAERDEQLQLAQAASEERGIAQPTVEVRPGSPQRHDSHAHVYTAGHRQDARQTSSNVRYADTQLPANRSGQWPAAEPARRTATRPAATSDGGDNLPAWSPNSARSEWDADAFQPPVRATPDANGLTAAQREQLRNQQ
jgi:tetratricopeptide (TPR) repeat protein